MPKRRKKIDKVAAMERIAAAPVLVVTEKVDLAEHVKGTPFKYRHGWIPRTPEINMPGRVNDSVLQSYSDNGYAAINNELRRTGGNVSAISGVMTQGAFAIPTRTAVEQLDSSLGVLTKRTKVYRVVLPEALGLGPNDDPRSLVGKTISDNGYLSTTLSRSSEMDAPISLEIDVPKGTRAINMQPFSLNSFETELLLDRNLKIKITGVRPDNRTSVNGVKRTHIITGKVLLPSATGGNQ